MLLYAGSMTKTFTTLQQLARQLGVPAAWLRSEAAAGRVPVLRAGRRWLFDTDAVEQVLRERAREQRKGAADE